MGGVLEGGTILKTCGINYPWKVNQSLFEDHTDLESVSVKRCRKASLRVWKVERRKLRVNLGKSKVLRR